MQIQITPNAFLFQSFTMITDAESDYPKVVKSRERAAEVLPKFIRYIGAVRTCDAYGEGELEIEASSLITMIKSQQFFFQVLPKCKRSDCGYTSKRSLSRHS